MGNCHNLRSWKLKGAKETWRRATGKLQIMGLGRIDWEKQQRLWGSLKHEIPGVGVGGRHIKATLKPPAAVRQKQL